MAKSSGWALVGSAFLLTALGGCRTAATPPDAGPLRDAAPTPYDAGPPRMDSGIALGTTYVRLVNIIPASPNLTVCLATIPGTGIPPAPARIIGQPDPTIMSDGTLPSPGVSPYLPAPVYDARGFGYELRLYSREELSFSQFGPCPDVGASPAPIATARIVADPMSATPAQVDHHYSLVLIGVLPNTPVQCTGACPEVQVRIFEDFLTPPTGTNVRVRLFQGVPNLDYPIHVCFDLDYRVDAMTGMVNNGPIPPVRSLPPAADTDGLAFGEVTPFINIPQVTSAGAFYTHATVPGVPDCDPSTLLLGPTTVPLPVPDTAPVDVARVFHSGDVITNFAFGRSGAPCTVDADCVAPSSVCTMAPCTCDSTHHCHDDLAGNLLPWRDVRWDAARDAGMPMADAGVDGG